MAPLVPGEHGSTGLVAGPVGRRVRRDRPAERKRPSLPTNPADDVDDLPPMPSADRGEQSPLPTAPLPPAALPTRANRLPSLDSLPQTPSSVVSPQARGPFEQAPSPAAPAIGGHVVAPEPVFDPAGLVVEDTTPVPEPVAPPDAVIEPVVEPVPEPVADPAPVIEPVVDATTPAARSALAVAADGVVAVPGTIVRLGGARRADATADGSGASIALAEGWCWVSPGDGRADPVRIDLSTGELTISTGATVLAVVEADGSAFVIVAVGHRRPAACRRRRRARAGHDRDDRSGRRGAARPRVGRRDRERPDRRREPLARRRALTEGTERAP